MNSLSAEIAVEKELIDKTLELIAEAMERPDLSVIELSAIASFLHHCYSGIENILKRILKSKNILLSDSPTSHKDLLNAAVEECVISQKLSDELDRFRGFRHFFVHAYGVLLEEAELLPLARDLPGVWVQFQDEIERVLKHSS